MTGVAPAGLHLLIYSHDTYGLGHLRRCRGIAEALTRRFAGLEILIVSGSSVTAAFSFAERIRVVVLPSVVKRADGLYGAAETGASLADILAVRRRMILAAVENFRPALFLCDKEPLGLHGELTPSLERLEAAGATMILGLRDVLDAPAPLALEWARKGAIEAMARFYRQIWVYGPAGFHDPLAGLPIAPEVLARVAYTGFLRREAPAARSARALDADSIVISAGGGGDGGALMLDILAAHEFDPSLTRPALMVLGPFCPPDTQAAIRERARRHRHLTLIDFDPALESLLGQAAALVAMGGYNTFCEILSLDARALIVPRVAPRLEQCIRARRAEALGLVDMLLPEQAREPAELAAALHRLPLRPRPSEAAGRIDLGGLGFIADRIAAIAEAIGRPLAEAAPASRRAAGSAP